MKRDILWITVDALRYDFTSMGSNRDPTPNIESVARRNRSQSFSYCFSHGLGTRISTSSILTGVYPDTHRVFSNSDEIPDDLQTVTERLQDIGYTTIGISPNVHVSSASNLDRGFDHFYYLGDPSQLVRGAGLTDLLKFAAYIRRHSAGFNAERSNHTPAYLMNKIAKRHFERSDPTFTYLHYLAPHSPYFPPLPYFREVCKEAGADEQNIKELIREVHEDPFISEKDISNDNLFMMKKLYEAEIRYIDRMIGSLLAQYQGNPIVIITADHGELFGEDGVLGHKVSMHPRLLNVPLVIRGLPKGRRQLVQHTDVIRTILDEVGADVGGVQGEHLERSEREYAITQRGDGVNLEEFPAPWNALGEKYLDGRATSVVTKEYQLITAGPDTAVNTVKSGEEVTDPDPDLSQRLSEYHLEWEQEQEISDFGTQKSEISNKTLKRLEELGYRIE